MRKSPRGESNPCRQLGRLVPRATRPLERKENGTTRVDPPPESRTPLCGLRARCITRQCLRGVHPRSAWEDSNPRAPVYQTGAWTGSATGGAGETRTHKTNRSGGFRDRFLIQPVPLRIRWGGLEPPPRGSQSRALPGELRTWDGVRRSGTFLGIRDTLARLAPGCLAVRPSLRSGAPGRLRTDALPLTRRVLFHSELQELAANTAGGIRTLTGTWPTTF